DRQQFGRRFRRELDTANRTRANESHALAPMIVDLQVVEPLSPDLDSLSLPEHGLFLPGAAWASAEHRAVLHDDRRGQWRSVRQRREPDDEQDECGERPREVDYEVKCDAQHDHRPAAACRVSSALRGCRPSSGAPMNPPSAGGGATITWILSDNLSASAFWIRSGCWVMSEPSRCICSALALPTRSRRYASASASFWRASASPVASIR